MGGSQPSNTTQNVIQTQNLPEWYQQYLQTTIGRGLSEATGAAPVYGAAPTAPTAPTAPDPTKFAGDAAGLKSAQDQYAQQNQQYQAQLGQYQQAKTQWDSLTPEQQAQSGQRIAGLTGAQNQAIGNIQGMSDWGEQPLWRGYEDLNKAASQNPLDVGNPYFQSGSNLINQGANLVGQGQQNVVGAASPYIQQSTQPTGLQAASPYLNAANQSLGAATNDALSPYLGGALNALSDQANYDLQNKYLPGVNDSFIKAGQFGSTRNQDITAQTIHDLSNTVQQNQASLINNAYGQAQNAAGQNLALKGTLGQTAGQLGTQQQQILQGAGTSLGNLTGAQGNLALQGANISGNLGQAQAGIGAQAGGLENAYNNTLVNAGVAQGNLGMQAQQRGLNYNNALYAAGTAQQTNQQQNLDTSYNDWLNQTFYPQNQTSWLSSIVRGLPAQPAGYGQTTQTQQPSNTGAQVAGLLGAGAGLAGGQSGYSGYGGYPQGLAKGGSVKRTYRNGGQVRGIGHGA